MEPPISSWLPFQVLGTLILLTATAVLVSTFHRFALEGFGTPAPVAPPDRLVIGGLYGYVRNPMYLAVLSAIIGQLLLFGQFILLAYAEVAAAASRAMVHWHEEPALERSFTDQYTTYRTGLLHE